MYSKPANMPSSSFGMLSSGKLFSPLVAATDIPSSALIKINRGRGLRQCNSARGPERCVLWGYGRRERGNERGPEEARWRNVFLPSSLRWTTIRSYQASVWDGTPGDSWRRLHTQILITYVTVYVFCMAHAYVSTATVCA
jgi:hypothetical protein